MGPFQFEIFCDSVVCGSGFKAFSAPLGRKGAPSPHSPSLCMMATPANLLCPARAEPPYPAGRAHFSHATTPIHSYPFHCFSSPTSQQQLYPRASQSAAKNCCQSKLHSHLQISKDKNMKLDIFNIFWESWLVCALNECSTLLLHDLKLLDFFFFSCDRNVFGDERPNLTRRFCYFGPIWGTSDTSLALLQCESDPTAQCLLAPAGQSANTGRANQEKLEVSYTTPI